MKKFCNKITKQQWRVSVPNINSNIFRRSQSKGEEDVDNKKSNDIKRTSSGCYDLEEAELAFDRSLSVPDAVYAETEVSTTSSSNSSDHKDDDEEDCYEDARNSSGINYSSSKTSIEDEYTTVNVGSSAINSPGRSSITVGNISVPSKSVSSQAIPSTSSSTNLTDNNAKFMYDVPKISFNFFDESGKMKQNNQMEGNSEEDYDTVVSSKPVHKTELNIVLTTPEGGNISVDDGNVNKSPCSSVYTDPEEILQAEQQQKIPIETETRFSHPIIVKCGSDPTLRTLEDDGLYKVPNSLLRRNRLSMSLNDFNPDNIETISSARSSIEHISCSQIIPQNQQNATNAADEYCKARSKLPMRLRRATFLRKPKSKAIDTWISLKGKVNEMMAHDGELSEREKLAINIEEMYKQSKNKCKKVFQNTSKMFKKKNEQQHGAKKIANLQIEHVGINQNGTEPVYSQIIKNDAFFDRVTEPSETNHANIQNLDHSESFDSFDSSDKVSDTASSSKRSLTKSVSDKKDDFPSLKNAFRRSKFYNIEGQNGFDDIRRYVKQGGDFCKELSVILQERSEAELQYAKSLSKLSGKLSKACREGVGDLNEAWRAVAIELENRAESHRILGTKILEEAAKPLRTLNENQHRIRKQAETNVDKTGRNLADWRAAEAKSKKHSHTCARDNEKLQDSIYDSTRLPRSTSLIHLAHLHTQKTTTDKENAKLEGKKKKAEDAVKKGDIEYYTLCVRAERARLEWESSVCRSSDTFQSLEEERLNNLKSVLNAYLYHNKELGPKLIETTEQLRIPVVEAEPSKDLTTFVNLRQSSQQASEQLLPDFYCEHITLAMNRERRKQALVKLLQLIRQDIDRERKSKNGLQNLSKAIKHTPNFGAEDSQQSVTEKLYHMKSMLTYLEGARYKLQNALAELDSRPRTGHPLAPHITITRDKSGLQQSVLKVPQWLREQYVEPEGDRTEKQSPLSEKSDKSSSATNQLNDPDWNDRGTADGNSNQPDSDFDEFSSQESIAADGICSAEDTSTVQPISQCRALYAYTPNLPDELTLHPGDILAVYRQQDDGWWLGECNGSVGIFPATYVETIKT